MVVPEGRGGQGPAFPVSSSGAKSVPLACSCCCGHLGAASLAPVRRRMFSTVMRLSPASGSGRRTPPFHRVVWCRTWSLGLVLSGLAAFFALTLLSSSLTWSVERDRLVLGGRLSKGVRREGGVRGGEIVGRGWGSSGGGGSGDRL